MSTRRALSVLSARYTVSRYPGSPVCMIIHSGGDRSAALYRPTSQVRSEWRTDAVNGQGSDDEEGHGGSPSRDRPPSTF
jgi:hypothetical protein